jgi:hypothetical protein
MTNGMILAILTLSCQATGADRQVMSGHLTADRHVMSGHLTADRHVMSGQLDADKQVMPNQCRVQSEFHSVSLISGKCLLMCTTINSCFMSIDWNFPCQTLKISKVSRVVMGS